MKAALFSLPSVKLYYLLYPSKIVLAMCMDIFVDCKTFNENYNELCNYLLK